MPSPPIQPNRQRDERTTLFPSLAYYDARRGTWRAVVQGRVYDISRIPISTRILLRGLKRALKATEAELASDIFRQRIQGFTAKPIRGRQISVELAGQQIVLRRKSKRNGAFLSVVKIPDSLAPDARLRGDRQSRVMTLRLNDVHSVGRSDSTLFGCETNIHLIGPYGVSIVSDIDDTIKATDVSSRRSMLTNTFLKPFAAVDGMANLYRQWQEAGADFHYVSSSPWELFEPLAELVQLNQFPLGSMHLRYFRIRDEMLKRWRPQRRKGKAGIIAGLIKKMPERKFFLVGDSGERDSEIYRFLARKFKRQVAAILIRQLDAKPLSARRIERVYDVPSGVHVRLFRHPEDLADIAGRIQKMV